METPKYKNALIVGAGAGLSASLARLLRAKGFKVALAARSIEKLGALCSETGARAYACNATDPDEVERLFGLVEREIGTPDVVVYNASARARGPFVDLVPAEVAQAITVSAFGGFLVAQQAAKRMLPQQARRDPVHGRLRQREGLRAVRAVCDGEICATRAGPEHGARIIAARHSYRAFCHRWRHSQRRPRRARRQAGFHARSRRDCVELLERAAAAAQRLGLGGRIAAVGGEVLRRASR